MQVDTLVLGHPVKPFDTPEKDSEKEDYGSKYEDHTQMI